MSSKIIKTGYTREVEQACAQALVSLFHNLNGDGPSEQRWFAGPITIHHNTIADERGVRTYAFASTTMKRRVCGESGDIKPIEPSVEQMVQDWKNAK